MLRRVVIATLQPLYYRERDTVPIVQENLHNVIIKTKKKYIWKIHGAEKETLNIWKKLSVWFSTMSPLYDKKSLLKEL